MTTLSELEQMRLRKRGEIAVNLPQIGDATCDECGAPGGIHTGQCATAARMNDDPIVLANEHVGVKRDE